MLHGAFQCSSIYKEAEVLNKLRLNNNFDTFMLNLNGHGKHFSELNSLDEKDLRKQLKDQILSLKRNYKRVKIVAFSLSGAIVLDLLNRKEEALKGVEIHLVAPAIFLKSNNVMNKVFVDFLSIFKDYCAWSLLDCAKSYTSVEVYNKSLIDKEARYWMVSLAFLNNIWSFDEMARNSLKLLNDVNVYIAQNDSLIDVERLVNYFSSIMPTEKIKIYEKGSHMIIWEKEFASELIKALER